MTKLYKFTGESPDSAWRATNDGVMGGLSQGRATITEEGMRFSGVLSLENNGGFSWIHTSGKHDLSGHKGIRFSVLGDGRTYELRLHSDAMFRRDEPVSFSHAFETVDDEWIEVYIPFDALKQSWRGRKLTGNTFNPSAIHRIGFMLADKKAGFFEMTVRWLAAD
ncbi:MAG: CIA30 family protein [Opitutales bacterium]